MTNVNKKVGPFKLDAHGMKSVGKSFLITIGGAAIGFIANLTGILDFGSYTTIAAALLPFISNFLYKLLGTYESK